VAVENEEEEAELRLLYSTGWATPALHASLCGGAWATFPMRKTASGQAEWTLPVPADATADSASALLEFVITDGNGNWDSGPLGANYVLPRVGAFERVDGRISEL